MKSSKYNICLPCEDKYLIFNGVTKRFFQVSSYNKEAFLQILSTPDDYIEKYAPFLKQMADEGFIIENSIHELDVIKQQYESMNNSEYYHLMILPTYACNVSCWYCTQKHRNIHIKEADVEIIKKHIVYYLTEKHLKGLHLSWFGGEPLLDFDKIIKISTFAQQFCKEHKLAFHNTITTNGILLSKGYLIKMKEQNFTFFQITVDGVQEEHDKVKVLRGRSAYETTLHNICMIAEIIPFAEICLRYNFTMRNIHPKPFVDDLCKYIPMSLRDRITLSLMKVWQEDEDNVDMFSVIELAKLASSKGFRVRYGSGFCTCYVDHQNFNCIFPNGLIDKCNNQDPDICRGMITEKGSVLWRKPIHFHTNTVFDDVKSDCIDCKYLPVCYGPCPRERDWVFGTKHITCRFTNKDKKWIQEIIHYCQSLIRNNQVIHTIITIFLLFSTFTTSFAQLDSIDNNSNNMKQVELDEVVVKGMNVVRYPDKNVWGITKEMRKNTFDTYSLLEKIPGFYYDRFEEKLSYWGQGNVLVTIDGKVKEGGRGGGLANIRFKKIEVYDHPEGRFAGYDVVVNLISYENWQGYDFRGLNSTTILPSSSYGNTFAKRKHDYTYTYTRPKYDISSNLVYSHDDTRYNQSLKVTGNNTQYYSNDDDGYTNIQKTTSYSFYVDFDNKINKNHTISAKYSFSDEDNDISSVNNITKEDFATEQIIGTRRYVSNLSNIKNHTISTFYQGTINKWLVNTELTYNSYLESSKYDYNESLNYEIESKLNNKRESWLLSLDAVKDMGKKGSFSSGYVYYNKYYMSDELLLKEVYTNRFIANKGYVNLSHSIGTSISVRIGTLIEYLNTSNSAETESQIIWGASANIRYSGMGGKLFSSLIYRTNTKYPTLYQTLSIKSQIDPILSFVGNTKIKTSTIHSLILSFRWDRISLSSALSFSGNEILPEFTMVGSNILRSYANIKSYRHNSVLSYFPRSCKLWGNDFQFSGSLNYVGNYIRQASQNKYVDSWGGQATLGYSINNIADIQIQYTKMTMKYLSLQTINQRAYDFLEVHLSKEFLKRQIECQLSYTLPVKWGLKCMNYTDVTTPFYQSYASYDIFGYTKNRIMLRMVIHLANGHVVKKKFNEQTQEKEVYNDFIN